MTLKPENLKPFIAVNTSPAMSGFFATLYDYSMGEGGINIHGEAFPDYWFPEPYETACGRHARWEDANKEGALWAEEIGVPFHPATAEEVEYSRQHALVADQRRLRREVLKEEGLEVRAAWKQAEAELPYPTRSASA